MYMCVYQIYMICNQKYINEEMLLKYTYTYTYVSIHVCMYACIYLCMYVCM